MKLENVVKTVLKQIDDSFGEVKQKKCVPYRIKYKGRYITLNSGKSLWKQLGHAKSALTNHLKLYSCCPHIGEDISEDWNMRHTIGKKLDEEILETIMKDIEFVPVIED